MACPCFPRTMKVLVQRVARARVLVDGEVVGEIGPGVVVFLGVERGDDADLARWYAGRLARMRLFPDEEGRPWCRDLREAEREALVVSQFTLAARTRRGRRPSFDPAAPPEDANRLYREFVAALAGTGIRVAEGRFRALMHVELVNEGPVTFLLDGPGGSAGQG